MSIYNTGDNLNVEDLEEILKKMGFGDNDDEISKKVTIKTEVEGAKDLEDLNDKLEKTAENVGKINANPPTSDILKISAEYKEAAKDIEESAERIVEANEKIEDSTIDTTKVKNNSIAEEQNKIIEQKTKELEQLERFLNAQYKKSADGSKIKEKEYIESYVKYENLSKELGKKVSGQLKELQEVLVVSDKNKQVYRDIKNIDNIKEETNAVKELTSAEKELNNARKQEEIKDSDSISVSKYDAPSWTKGAEKQIEQQNKVQAELQETQQEAKETAAVLSQANKESVKIQEFKISGDKLTGVGYHATRGMWDGNFDFEKTKAAQMGSGMYLTSDLEKVSVFGKAQVKQVELSLEKCFILTNDYMSNIEDLYKAMNKEMPKTDITAKEALSEVRNYNRSSKENSNSFRQNMLSMGYQGMYTGDYLANKNIPDELVIYDEKKLDKLVSFTNNEFQDLKNNAQRINIEFPETKDVESPVSSTEQKKEEIDLYNLAEKRKVTYEEIVDKIKQIVSLQEKIKILDGQHSNDGKLYNELYDEFVDWSKQEETITNISNRLKEIYSKYDGKISLISDEDIKEAAYLLDMLKGAGVVPELNKKQTSFFNNKKFSNNDLFSFVKIDESINEDIERAEIELKDLLSWLMKFEGIDINSNLRKQMDLLIQDIESGNNTAEEFASSLLKIFNIKPSLDNETPTPIDNIDSELKSKIETIKKEKAVLAEIREANDFGDYGEKDSMSDEYYNEAINGIKSMDVSYESVLDTLTKIRNLEKERSILYGQMNGLNVFSDEYKNLKNTYDYGNQIKELEKLLPTLDMFIEKTDRVISSKMSDSNLELYTKDLVNYSAQAKLELDEMSDVDYINLIQSLDKITTPIKEVKKEADLANKELVKLGDVYRAVRSQDLEFLDRNPNGTGAIWATSEKDLYNTLYTGHNKGKEYSAELYARNPLVIDAKGQNFNEITYLGDGVDEVSKQITELYNRIQELTEARKASYAATGSETQEYIELSKQLGLAKTQYDELSKSRSNVYGTHFTDEFIDLAKANGYDALKIENVYDSTNNLATTYAVWSDEQVKNIQLIASGEEELLQLHNQLQSEYNQTIDKTEEAEQAVKKYKAATRENTPKLADKTNISKPSFTEEPSGQLAMFEGVEEKQKEIAQAVEKTNEVIEGQIDLFQYLDSKGSNTETNKPTSSSIADDIDKERQETSELANYINEVLIKAIKDKTQAFENGKIAINGYVQEEISDLERLKEQIQEIVNALDLLKDPIELNISVPKDLSFVNNLKESLENVKNELATLISSINKDEDINRLIVDINTTPIVDIPTWKAAIEKVLNGLIVDIKTTPVVTEKIKENKESSKTTNGAKAKKPTKILSEFEIDEEIEKIRTALNLASDEWDIKITQSGKVAISTSDKVSEGIKKVHKNFEDTTDAIENFHKKASSVTLSNGKEDILSDDDVQRAVVDIDKFVGQLRNSKAEIYDLDKEAEGLIKRLSTISTTAELDEVLRDFQDLKDLFSFSKTANLDPSSDVNMAKSMLKEQAKEYKEMWNARKKIAELETSKGKIDQENLAKLKEEERTHTRNYNVLTSSLKKYKDLEVNGEKIVNLQNRELELRKENEKAIERTEKLRQKHAQDVKNAHDKASRDYWNGRLKEHVSGMTTTNDELLSMRDYYSALEKSSAKDSKNLEAELNNAIKEYADITSRIAKGEILEGNSEEIVKKLEDRISELQKSPLLSDEQIKQAEKKVIEAQKKARDLEEQKLISQSSYKEVKKDYDLKLDQFLADLKKAKFDTTDLQNEANELKVALEDAFNNEDVNKVVSSFKDLKREFGHLKAENTGVSFEEDLVKNSAKEQKDELKQVLKLKKDIAQLDASGKGNSAQKAELESQLNYHERMLKIISQEVDKYKDKEINGRKLIDIVKHEAELQDLIRKNQEEINKIEAKREDKEVDDLLDKQAAEYKRILEIKRDIAMSDGEDEVLNKQLADHKKEYDLRTQQLIVEQKIVSETEREKELNAANVKLIEQIERLEKDKADRLSIKPISEVQKAYETLLSTEKQFAELEAKRSAGLITSSELKIYDELDAKRKLANEIVSKAINLTNEETAAQRKYNIEVEKTKALKDDLSLEGYKGVLTKDSDIAETNARLQAIKDKNVRGLSDEFAKVAQEVKDLNIELARGDIELDEYQAKVNSKINELNSIFAVLDKGSGIKEAEQALKEYLTGLDRLEGKGVKINSVFDSNTNSYKITAQYVDKLKDEIQVLGYTYANTSQVIALNSKKPIEYVTKWGEALDWFKKKAGNVFGYVVSFGSFYELINIFRQGVNVVREFDTALTEMRKVSDETVASLKDFQKVSFDIAESVGTTALQIQNSTADFMRLGLSLNDATEAAKNANILLNVSEFNSIEEATESLVAVQQAYKDLDGMSIVDKLNAVGNNFSISTDQLAVGLQKSSATLSLMGNSIDEAAAMITAANSTIQDVDSVAAGIKTISLRLVGTEQAKEELQALGEEAQDAFISGTKSKKRQIIKDYTAVASNNFQGVDILDANGNYKNTYEILKSIGEVYKEIQETDKKMGTNRAVALVEELAGKNRSNILSSLLTNVELLDEVIETSSNSAGSALEENEKKIQSIEGENFALIYRNIYLRTYLIARTA